MMSAVGDVVPKTTEKKLEPVKQEQTFLNKTLRKVAIVGWSCIAYMVIGAIGDHCLERTLYEGSVCALISGVLRVSLPPNTPSDKLGQYMAARTLLFAGLIGCVVMPLSHNFIFCWPHSYSTVIISTFFPKALAAEAIATGSELIRILLAEKTKSL